MWYSFTNNRLIAPSLSLSVSVSLCLSLCLSLPFSVCLSVCLSLSVSLSLSLSLCLSLSLYLSLSLFLSLSLERLKLFFKKYTRIEKAQKKIKFVYAATKAVFGGPTLNDTNLQQKTKCLVSRKQNISYKSMDECIF